MPKTPTRFDECLATRDGHLFIGACDTVERVRQFGSPLFVISESQLRRNTQRFRRAETLEDVFRRDVIP